LLRATLSLSAGKIRPRAERWFIARMLDWQRDILPVLRATYDFMDEQQSDFLDGSELIPHLVAQGHDDDALYRIFTQVNEARPLASGIATYSIGSWI
jgi:hypothetical protein